MTLSIPMFHHELYCLEDLRYLKEQSARFTWGQWKRLYGADAAPAEIKEALFEGLDGMTESVSFNNWMKLSRYRRHTQRMTDDTASDLDVLIEDWCRYVHEITRFFERPVPSNDGLGTFVVISSLSDNIDWGFEPFRCLPIISVMDVVDFPYISFYGHAVDYKLGVIDTDWYHTFYDIGVKVATYCSEIATIFYSLSDFPGRSVDWSWGFGSYCLHQDCPLAIDKEIRRVSKIAKTYHYPIPNSVVEMGWLKIHK